jgi:hypothetical protein
MAASIFGSLAASLLRASGFFFHRSEVKCQYGENITFQKLAPRTFISRQREKARSFMKEKVHSDTIKLKCWKTTRKIRQQVPIIDKAAQRSEA